MNPNTKKFEELTEQPSKLSKQFSVGDIVELEGRDFVISYINDSKQRLVLEPSRASTPQ